MFSEGHVETDGFRIRYMEAGQGAPLVHLLGPGELRLTAAHDLLARGFRVIAFEVPAPADACGAHSMPVLASAMARAARSLDLESFNLLGTSLGGAIAVWMALHVPARILALVLETPDRDADVDSRLPGLTTPTLVLLGTRDTTTAQRMGRACKERIPNCHLVYVHDAGPAIARDRPAAFAEVVSDFLERHEAFVISRTETVIHP